MNLIWNDQFYRLLSEFRWKFSKETTQQLFFFYYEQDLGSGSAIFNAHKVMGNEFLDWLLYTLFDDKSAI